MIHKKLSRKKKIEQHESK